MDQEPMPPEEKPLEQSSQPEQTTPAEEQIPVEETSAAPLETPPATPAIPQTPVEEPPPSPEATEGQASPEPDVPPAPTIETPASPQPTQPSLKSFLEKALQSIQFRKKAKSEKIMKLAHEKRSITNDQVEKLLRVSDATATRYLSALVREGRLQRFGNRGSARYEPTIGSIPTV